MSQTKPIRYPGIDVFRLKTFFRETFPSWCREKMHWQVFLPFAVYRGIEFAVLYFLYCVVSCIFPEKFSPVIEIVSKQKEVFWRSLGVISIIFLWHLLKWGLLYVLSWGIFYIGWIYCQYKNKQGLPQNFISSTFKAKEIQARLECMWRDKIEDSKYLHRKWQMWWSDYRDYEYKLLQIDENDIEQMTEFIDKVRLLENCEFASPRLLVEFYKLRNKKDELGAKDFYRNLKSIFQEVGKISYKFPPEELKSPDTKKLKSDFAHNIEKHFNRSWREVAKGLSAWFNGWYFLGCEKIGGERYLSILQNGNQICMKNWGEEKEKIFYRQRGESDVEFCKRLISSELPSPASGLLMAKIYRLIAVEAKENVENFVDDRHRVLVYENSHGCISRAHIDSSEKGKVEIRAQLANIPTKKDDIAISKNIYRCKNTDREVKFRAIQALIKMWKSLIMYARREAISIDALADQPEKFEKIAKSQKLFSVRQFYSELKRITRLYNLYAFFQSLYRLYPEQLGENFRKVWFDHSCQQTLRHYLYFGEIDEESLLKDLVKLGLEDDLESTFNIGNASPI